MVELSWVPWRAQSARPVACHVIVTLLNPGLLSYTAPHDVASNVCHALPTTLTARSPACTTRLFSAAALF